MKRFVLVYLLIAMVSCTTKEKKTVDSFGEVENDSFVLTPDGYYVDVDTFNSKKEYYDSVEVEMNVLMDSIHEEWVKEQRICQDKNQKK